MTKDSPGSMDAPARRFLRPVAGLADLLVDPARRGFALAGLLVTYVVVWTFYGIITTGSQNLAANMFETIAWSQQQALDFLKRPPLSASLMTVWFSIMPPSDFTYYVFGMMLAAAGLWIAWVLSADFLDGYKRVAGLALLMLIPFFNFYTLRYNINTLLIPIWTVTTLWFLRSFVTGDHVYAALAGLGMATGLLGRYWTLFLVAGLLLAALSDPRRRRYFSSAAPWITVVIGLMALGPHLIWLNAHRFQPLLEAFSKEAIGTNVADLPGYLANTVALVSLPIGFAVYLTMLRSPAQASPEARRGVWRDILIPSSPNRRFIAIVFWIQLLAPVLAMSMGLVDFLANWTMPTWALLAIVLLSTPKIVVTRQTAIQFLAVAVAFPLIMLALSPAIAQLLRRSGVESPSVAHARLLAQKVTEEWQARFTTPLQIVGGDPVLARSAAEYLPDARSGVRDLGRVDPAQLVREGAVALCYAADADCIAQARARLDGLAAALPGTSGAQLVSAELQRVHMGYRGTPRRYTILILPPRAPR